jgi:polyphosphate kinase
MSDNIEVVHIIGRYLEHSRILAFGNAGKPLYYLTSADWMVRNIEHRIEVSIPILDEHIQRELQAYLDLQSAFTKKRSAKRVEKQATVAVQDAMHNAIKNFK